MKEGYINQLLEELAQEWSYPGGFFVKARYGEMDNDGYNHVISILERMAAVLSDSQDETTLDRNLVLRLWDIPWFLQLQNERIHKFSNHDSSIYWSTWCAKIYTLIYKIFGHDLEEERKKHITKNEEPD
jgi:hypothetical protein